MQFGGDYCKTLCWIMIYKIRLVSFLLILGFKIRISDWKFGFKNLALLEKTDPRPPLADLKSGFVVGWDFSQKLAKVAWFVEYGIDPKWPFYFWSEITAVGLYAELNMLNKLLLYDNKDQSRKNIARALTDISNQCEKLTQVFTVITWKDVNSNLANLTSRFSCSKTAQSNFLNFWPKILLFINKLRFIIPVNFS